MSGTRSNELLDAVRAFLRAEVMPELDAFRSYNTRIAANALGIVQRELELGPQLEALDQAMADELGLDPRDGPVAVQVARALRSGILQSDEALLEWLRRRTVLSIRIDNPKYSGLRQAEARWGKLQDQ